MFHFKKPAKRSGKRERTARQPTEFAISSCPRLRLTRHAKHPLNRALAKYVSPLKCPDQVLTEDSSPIAAPLSDVKMDPEPETVKAVP